jgi:hypothetical protein
MQQIKNWLHLTKVQLDPIEIQLHRIKIQSYRIKIHWHKIKAQSHQTDKLMSNSFTKAIK